MNRIDVVELFGIIKALYQNQFHKAQKHGGMSAVIDLLKNEIVEIC